MKTVLIFWSIFILFGFLFRKKFIWEKDKTIHWIIGCIIPIITWLIGGLSGLMTNNQILCIGFGSCILLALCKELIWDKLLKKGNCSLMDFIFTFAGGFSGTFFFVLPILNN